MSKRLSLPLLLFICTLVVLVLSSAGFVVSTLVPSLRGTLLVVRLLVSVILGVSLVLVAFAVYLYCGRGQAPSAPCASPPELEKQFEAARVRLLDHGWTAIEARHWPWLILLCNDSADAELLLAPIADGATRQTPIGDGAELWRLRDAVALAIFPSLWAGPEHSTAERALLQLLKTAAERGRIDALLCAVPWQGLTSEASDTAVALRRCLDLLSTACGQRLACHLLATGCEQLVGFSEACRNVREPPLFGCELVPGAITAQLSGQMERLRDALFLRAARRLPESPESMLSLIEELPRLGQRCGPFLGRVFSNPAAEPPWLRLAIYFCESGPLGTHAPILCAIEQTRQLTMRGVRRSLGLSITRPCVYLSQTALQKRQQRVRVAVALAICVVSITSVYCGRLFRAGRSWLDEVAGTVQALQVFPSVRFSSERIDEELAREQALARLIGERPSPWLLRTTQAALRALAARRTQSWLEPLYAPLATELAQASNCAADRKGAAFVRGYHAAWAACLLSGACGVGVATPAKLDESEQRWLTRYLLRLFRQSLGPDAERVLGFPGGQVEGQYVEALRLAATGAAQTGELPRELITAQAMAMVALSQCGRDNEVWLAAAEADVLSSTRLIVENDRVKATTELVEAFSAVGCERLFSQLTTPPPGLAQPRCSLVLSKEQRAPDYMEFERLYQDRLRMAFADWLAGVQILPPPAPAELTQALELLEQLGAERGLFTVLREVLAGPAAAAPKEAALRCQRARRLLPAGTPDEQGTAVAARLAAYQQALAAAAQAIPIWQKDDGALLAELRLLPSRGGKLGALIAAREAWLSSLRTAAPSSDEGTAELRRAMSAIEQQLVSVERYVQTALQRAGLLAIERAYAPLRERYAALHELGIFDAKVCGESVTFLREGPAKAFVEEQLAPFFDSVDCCMPRRTSAANGGQAVLCSAACEVLRRARAAATPQRCAGLPSELTPVLPPPPPLPVTSAPLPLPTAVEVFAEPRHCSPPVATVVWDNGKVVTECTVTNQRCATIDAPSRGVGLWLVRSGTGRSSQELRAFPDRTFSRLEPLLLLGRELTDGRIGLRFQIPQPPGPQHDCQSVSVELIGLMHPPPAPVERAAQRPVQLPRMDTLLPLSLISLCAPPLRSSAATSPARSQP